LSFQLADFGQVLADFEASPVVSFGIPDREVADIDKFTAQFDPERRRVPEPEFEGIRILLTMWTLLGGWQLRASRPMMAGLLGNIRSGPSE
jgi:hypothetical protein